MSKVKFIATKVTRRGRRPSVFKAHVPKRPRKYKVIQKIAEKSGVSYEKALSIANALERVVIENGLEYLRTTIEGLKRWELFSEDRLKELEKMGF